MTTKTIKSAEIPQEKHGILAPKDAGILAYTKQPKKRVWEIDFLRGLCIILMILDHTALLLGDFFGPAWYETAWINGKIVLIGDGFGVALCNLCRDYWVSGLREVGHPVVLFIFFSISGISCAFSRSNFKRGFELAIISLIYTLGSYIGQEYLGVGNILVTFGVLHFYAFCILLWAVICALADAFAYKGILPKEKPSAEVRDFAQSDAKSASLIIKTAVSATLVILVACLFHCCKAPATTPEWLFFLFPFENVDGTSATFYYVGDVSPGDLFNIIPWSAFFFFGTFIQPFIYPRKRSLLPCLDHAWHKPVCFVGRHALLVYILHIVVVAAVLMVISQIAFGTWGLI
ncbi:MAG: DUF1624 domain-containing protein [Clostridia bacterium]|nr:DUF1624 domain-containing protein [Clostridia bacterium]